MAWAQNLNFAGSSDGVLPSLAQYTAFASPYFVGTTTLTGNSVQNSWYWSSDEAVAGVSALAMHNGRQQAVVGETNLFYAVAVRAADATAVPEPQSMALVLLALGAGAVATRRRGAQQAPRSGGAASGD